MNLSSPVGSLIPSMDGVVLEVLAGTHSALGPSRIHALGHRGSRPGVSLALGRLADQGLVHAEPTNYGHTYRLNRDHVLAPAVLAAAEARAEFLRRLTAGCQALRPAPLSVALYGSVARRESDDASDIDLLVVVDDTLDRHAPEWTDQTDKLTQSVRAWTGNRLEPIVMDANHLAGLAIADDPLTLSLREDAVTLVGRDLRELLDQAVHTGRRTGQ
ncbi:MAG: nucleotidyltransferase domain-containing protein [Micropruina sp.]|nr:nucleotidyltransferase domain-containing protein [Micropruina sp.]